MILKKIHYCWFGNGEKNKKVKKCIESWKKFCPDYEIIEWNEKNFDVNQNEYTKMCYSENKFAFLSDYARLIIIAENGGVYFDTDVQLIKPIDSLLENEAFFGFETDDYVNTGHGFGSVANGTLVNAMVDEYTQILDGKHGVIGCPILNTEALIKFGLIRNGEEQIIENSVILPIDYMNPYESTTGRLNKTENTFSIHWYSGSWMTKGQLIRSTITKPIHRLFGNDALKKH
ncbi:MAG: glycosyl transferase [Ruminococcus sp.]|nr:glycosyl transferase [Candidatus Copronaster equi]